MFGKKKRKQDPRERFVAVAAAIIGGRDDVDRVERVGDMDLVGERDGTEIVRASLSNLWLEVQDRTEQEQDDVLVQVLRVSPADQPGTWDEVAPTLIPAVRSAAFVAGMSGVARPLAPLLFEALVEDQPDQVAFVSDERIAALGANVDEAFDRAHANLIEQGIDVEPLDGDLEGCMGITGPPHHESAWLAIPEALAQVAGVAEGRMLVLAPTTVNAVLVPVDDGGAVVRALEWARVTYLGGPRPLSPVPYVVVDGVLQPWSAPVDHPAAAAVALARAQFTSSEYAEQTEQLQNALTESGVDIYVAAVTAVQDAAGNAFTFAAWPENVTDELLPQVDRLALMDENQGIFMVPWDDVVELVGDHMEPGEWNPLRWRVRGWPTPDVVEALRARAVE